MNVLVEGQDSLYLNCAAAIVGADDELAWAEDFVTQSPDYKWILGKYVEAGKANSNRQLIDVAGIEHARGNLPHAPLNLNHTQTMVGTFVATEFLAEEKAAQSQGHLEALSVFWAHRFPHEWERIEVAHANKRLYYSMESRPSEVRCVGNRGCGEEFAYAGRQSSTYCPHLNDPRKFDSEKLMLNPRFRGGALIIPPTKPGWAEATIDQIADLVKEAVDGKDRNWEDIAQILASNDELRKAALIERLAESARGC